MTKRTQLKSLPVRVQFTLNPILHRDAIVLLQNLSKNELAETVAGLLQWGALVQNGMAHGDSDSTCRSTVAAQRRAGPKVDTGFANGRPTTVVRVQADSNTA
ncbi:MAG: hypothetical protein IPO19_15205 [Rhodoferax sp.]|nr:hypothetical protein [Rhodoferax sp.]